MISASYRRLAGRCDRLGTASDGTAASQYGKRAAMGFWWPNGPDWTFGGTTSERRQKDADLRGTADTGARGAQCDLTMTAFRPSTRGANQGPVQPPRAPVAARLTCGSEQTTAQHTGR